MWCGHGEPVGEIEAKMPRRLRRLPRDLGAIQREGRRPDPHLDNVVRLDRLKDFWKVPRLTLVPNEPRQGDRPEDREAMAA